GSKSEYKKALEKNYMNDSVFRFLKKHERTADEILSSLMSSGKYPSTNDAMRATVLSDEFVAVKQVIVLFEKSVTIGENTYFSTGGEHTKEEALEIAETVLKKAQSGEDFDSLMKEYGESLILDEQYVCRGMWNKAEEDAVFALSQGQLSAVVEGESGYSVFLAVKKNESNIDRRIEEITASYYEAQYNILLEQRIAKLEVKPLEAYGSYAGKKDEN
ncbi:MAG: peptidylprolyl isomerase, partial [Clostridia bacterium]|nr:peptidylprolyl isomerase [Clostridia bacterium]